MTSPVRKTSAAIDGLADNWPVIAALMGGTSAMRKAAKTYLPKFPGENEADYGIRLSVATLFPAYSRTVSVLTGKPFSKPLTYSEDVPARILEWTEDIDLQGRNLHTFAADLCEEALAFGICGILVDHPPAEGVRTVADEQSAGVRPYFVHVAHDSILGWQTARIAGKTILTQLRLLELVEEPDGEFATRIIDQVRVLTPGAWATYRKMRDDDDSWEQHAVGVTSLPYIPFVPIYGRRKAYMNGLPPMMELAHANVEHWQSKSDQQTILHVARCPILFGKNMPDDSITLGASSFVGASGDSDIDLKYVEHSGKAIDSGRLSILDLEDRMRQVGAELLVIKPGNTSVVQTQTDNEQGMCDLGRIMQSAENALDQALQFMADWVKLPQGGHVQIYRDFGAATLAEASAALVFDMNSTGKLSNATTINELKRRGILSADIDTDEEIVAAKADAPPTPVVTQELVKP